MTTFQRKRWRRVTTFPSSNLWTGAALILAAALTEASPLQAQEEQQQAQPKQERPSKHIVRPGDTLWDLARFYLEDAFLWPEIYRLNTVVIEDPHWIYADEQLALPRPGELGREVPDLIAVQTPTTTPPGVPPAVPPGVLPPVVIAPAGEQTPDEAALRPDERGEQAPGAETFLPPVVGEIPQVVRGDRTIFVARAVERQTLVYQPTAPIPAEAVTRGDFHRSGMLTSLDELGPRGELVGFIAPNSGTAATVVTAADFTRVYVSHLDGQVPEPGARLLLFRIDRRLRPYGYVIRPTGVATVAAVHEDVSIAVITQTFDRIQVGNQIKFAEPFELDPGIFPEPVEAGPTGELVAFLDRQNIHFVEDVAFIDVGRNEGIVLGDEFEIYLPKRASRSRLRLPEEHIATGRVVRVTEETATVRLVEQRHPALRVGLPVRLVRKMPL